MTGWEDRTLSREEGEADMRQMTLAEAGRVLREMYEGAPYGEQAAHIHLFGIKYGDVLGRLTNEAIVREAGIGRSYHSEVAKGRKLAKYVTPRTTT